MVAADLAGGDRAVAGHHLWQCEMCPGAADGEVGNKSF